MLYIFDLGNVIINIDFNRAMGVWSNLSGVPLAVISERFSMEKAFEQHERGDISDEEFAEQLSEQMGLTLSFEQFALGWQAIFVDVRHDVVEIMQRLRREGHRVVILSNTNNLHTTYWPVKFPEVISAADKAYLSQEIGMRKPEDRIYRYVLEQEGVAAGQAVFFDDNEANIMGARSVGLHSVHVTDSHVVPAYFADLES